MSRKLNLYGTVSVAALLLSIGAASAQENVTQGTTTAPVINTGNVEVRGDLGAAEPIVIEGAAGIGVAGSLSILGSGSQAALSVLHVGAGSPTLPDGGFGAVSQVLQHTGPVDVDSTRVESLVGLQTVGRGGSIAISGSGASGSASFVAIGVDAARPAFTLPGVGSIEQRIANSSDGVVTVSDNEIERNRGLGGDSSSLSISGVGASANVSFRAIDAGSYLPVSGSSVGNVTSFVSNAAPVDVTDNSIDLNRPISGDNASASISAVGVSASVSASSVGSDDFGRITVGNIRQGGEVTGSTPARVAVNTGAISNIGSEISNTTNPDNPRSITGSAASASIAAIGGSFSVGTSSNNDTDFGGAQFGNVTQASIIGNNQNRPSTTSGAVLVQDGVIALNDLAGSAASAGISAVGVSSSVFATAIESGTVAGTSFGDIVQQSGNDGNGSNITNQNNQITVADVRGPAASASIRALGGGNDVSSTAIGTTSYTGPNTDTISQSATSRIGNVIVTGAELTAQEVSGVAASVGTSATGASNSVSETGIGNVAFTGGTFGTINQGTDVFGNSNAVNNQNSVVGVTGDVGGTGASASITTTGIAGSVSSTAVGNTGDFEGSTFGAITQNIGRWNPVSNVGAELSVGGDLSGTSASASVSATLASASVASTSLENSGDFTGATFGMITQNVRAYGRFADGTTVTGAEVTVGGEVSGIAASVGVNATGASGSVSSASIGDSGTMTAAQFGGLITQNVTLQPRDNANGTQPSNVFNTGSTVETGDVSGLAASVGIGVTGASAAVSASAIGSATADTPANFSGGITQNVTASRFDQGTTNESNSAVTLTDGSITTGAISGTAASASLSARGASGAVNVSTIATGAAPGASTIGAVNQTITNEIAVSIIGGSITANGLAGVSSSASIAATGASASLGVSSINDTAPAAAVDTGPIVQAAVNNAPVSVTNASINVGGSLGVAASASIAAVGASSSVSFTTISAP